MILSGIEIQNFELLRYDLQRAYILREEHSHLYYGR